MISENCCHSKNIIIEFNLIEFNLNVENPLYYIINTYVQPKEKPSQKIALASLFSNE